MEQLKVSNLENLDVARSEKIFRILKDFDLSDETIMKVREAFESELNLGLELNPKKPSCLQMANTFVPELPNGTEKGDFLALDLGGTNFRILFLSYKEGKLEKEIFKFFTIGESLRMGEGDKLFDFLAECIASFIDENDLKSRKLPLGFTFSFPMDQKSLNCGILVTWTKTFNCPNVAGNDVVKLLNEAIKRRGDINVDVNAILNDTTGTLVQGAYLDKNCGIGLILATGSNACYLEKVEKVMNWGNEAQPESGKEVIIDIEWGAFGDNGVIDFIKTEFDKKVDDRSLLKNSFTFEKYLSGKYLGEIVRVILVQLIEDNLLFGGSISEILSTHDIFTTNFISSIEEDTIKNEDLRTSSILTKLEITFDKKDIEIVKYVCYLVTLRASVLVSICLATLLDRMDKKESVTIAIDGSVYQFHPRMKNLMETYISKFTGKRFSLMLAEDGSGKGAGLVAAISNRLN